MGQSAELVGCALAIAALAIAALVGCGDGAKRPPGTDTDAGDAGDDGSAPDQDAGVVPGWEDCPGAETYVGDDAWELELTVQDNATYCVPFRESWPLEDVRAEKAQLHLTSGMFRLPQNAADAPFSLPLCVRLESGELLTSKAGGAISSEADAWDASFQRVRFRVPLERRTEGGGATPRGSLKGELRFLRASDPSLNGSPNAASIDYDPDAIAWRLEYCAEGECEDWPYPKGSREFDACSYAAADRRERHAVAFDGGEVTLELNIGVSPASTEPGAFERASGTFEGHAFDQRDYWKLVYSPAHHHFSRTFAVLFEEPIDDVCGLEITGLEPWEDMGGDYTPNEVFTLDCNLGRVGERTVSTHEWIRE